MGGVTLITGGARSGKSRHALRLAESTAGPRTFIATCPAVDAEMRERIERHRREREGRGWATIEEETDLAGALARAEGVALVDCLTLWVNNLVHAADLRGEALGEDTVAALAADAVAAAADRPEDALFVTNEVGMGIVPDNAAARRFRDLAGRCNQVAAAAADRVLLLVSGIPHPIK